MDNIRIIEVHKNIITLPIDIKPIIIKINAGFAISAILREIIIWKSNIPRKGMYEDVADVTIIKGYMTIGNGFSANKNCLLSCTNKVTICDNV